MSKLTVDSQDLYSKSFDDYILPVYITAPNTTIANRAQVLDTSNTLQSLFGVEKLPTRSLLILNKESGPNGELVYEVESKDSRIRFYGDVSTFSFSDGTGVRLGSSSLGVVEITFYGTGLNILQFSNGGANRNATISIDGGAPSAFVYDVTTRSPVLQQRNYNMNVVSSLAAGLALGWHTVLLSHNEATELFMFGFEVINARTDIAITPGTALVNTLKSPLNALSTSAYNAGVVGTRGARVVKYLLNGAISQSVQEVEQRINYFTSTDHTNEEIVRRINFREFGSQRSDDFSTLSTSRASAFTLEDGITSLVSNAVEASSLALDMSTNGGFITIIFVGTGLDIIRSDTGNGGSDTYTLQVDNEPVQNFPSAGITGIRITKLCSGLPYGTHTIKITRVTAVAWGLSIRDFIIYQPKKPSIPAGAIEVSDYNLISSYIPSTSAAYGTMSQGVLRRQMMREMLYSGNWAWGIDVATFDGNNTRTVVNGSWVEHTFFGTGIEYRAYFTAGDTNNVTVSIDGSSNLSSYTTALVASVSGLTFTASTGFLGGSIGSTNNGYLRITGLTLGFHKIRIQSNNATTTMYINSFDAITPIHINPPNARLLNTVKANSKTSPAKTIADPTKAKVILSFDGVNNKIQYSKGVAQVLRSITGTFIVYFEKPFVNNNYTITHGGDTEETSTVTTSRRAHSCMIMIGNSSGGAQNEDFEIVILGDLANE